ncbi:hypothetical protein KSMBR1_1552 [Candidatus Kuenenia stuttgartiensis]|uniref:Uncharacterized protein n=1 Tax=Kuenenia stuttgartiensis TaxID=174633 RepID=A0A2C9CEC5_KUEST|nr:hypothetical protein KSMBR1_1552 [Candidatus Kuenenia stuttgartiensis]
MEAGAHDALILTTEGNVADVPSAMFLCGKTSAVFTLN